MKTWFVTGAPRGLGHAWIEGALERGDRVVASGREIDLLDEFAARFGDRLLRIRLDITDRDAVFAVLYTKARFGPFCGILRRQKT